MSAATQLYDLLRVNVPLAAVVGDRIFKTIVPDGTPSPAIAYRRSNTEYTQTIHGPIPASKQSFDIYCIAVSNAVADQVGDLVEGIAPSPGTVAFIDRIDDYDPDTELYATIITVEVWQTT